MGLLEQQNFLARLFTDKNLRQNFGENPNAVGFENNLNEDEINQLEQIITSDLNFFADSLFHKRLHEVEKLLPLTKKALAEKFTAEFRKFSENFQPQSVKKHLEDAISFCQYLLTNPTLSPQAHSTVKFELTKHEFFGLDKNFAFCFLSHNVFSLNKKAGFAIWYRRGGNTRFFIW